MVKMSTGYITAILQYLLPLPRAVPLPLSTPWQFALLLTRHHTSGLQIAFQCRVTVLNYWIKKSLELKACVTSKLKKKFGRDGFPSNSTWAMFCNKIYLSWYMYYKYWIYITPWHCKTLGKHTLEKIDRSVLITHLTTSPEGNSEFYLLLNPQCSTSVEVERKQNSLFPRGVNSLLRLVGFISRMQ